MRLNRSKTLLQVIDIQEKLLPMIRHHDEMIRQVRRLLQGAALFEIPVLATEQYPKGIGRTVAPVANLLNASGAEMFEKMSFSCCADGACQDRIRATGRRQVVIAGIESHVCVLQTALDLALQGYEIAVCADATGSRSERDYDIAMERLRHAGVTVATVESVLFELCRECGTAEFKQMLELIK